MEYYCECCNYKTNKKQNFQKHNTSKRHKINMYKKNNLEEITCNMNTCLFCHKKYKHKSGLSRHMKLIHPDSDFLLECINVNQEENEQLSLQQTIEELKNKLDDATKKMEEMYYLNKTSNTTTNNTINNNNGTINNVTQVNFQINNYNHTDYEFLTNSDYMTAIRDCNHCVKTLIEKVHFNKKKPENMNIYISSIKGKFIMVYRDNKWQVKLRKAQIDDLYDYNELMLDNWIDEYHEKYPHIIKSFKRYLNNKDEDNQLINKVKDEILLMLYNQRDKVIKHHANNIQEIPEELPEEIPQEIPQEID